MTSKLDTEGVPDNAESLVMLSVTRDGKRYEQYVAVHRTGDQIKTIGTRRLDVTKFFDTYIDL